MDKSKIFKEMKNLKTLLTAVFFGLCLTAVTAQERNRLSPEQKQEVKENLKANMDRLQLTPDQKKSYLEINSKFGQQLKESRLSGLSKEEKLKKAKDLKDQRDAEMKTLLSAEQYTTYLQIQKENKEKMREIRKSKSAE